MLNNQELLIWNWDLMEKLLRRKKKKRKQQRKKKSKLKANKNQKIRKMRQSSGI